MYICSLVKYCLQYYNYYSLLILLFTLLLLLFTYITSIKVYITITTIFIILCITKITVHIIIII